MNTNSDQNSREYSSEIPNTGDSLNDNISYDESKEFQLKSNPEDMMVSSNNNDPQTMSGGSLGSASLNSAPPVL